MRETLQAAIASMSSSPLAIALLLVNVAFLVFVSMMMHDIAENAGTRDRANAEMISKLLQVCKT
jgi:hypothetical protein